MAQIPANAFPRGWHVRHPRLVGVLIVAVVAAMLVFSGTTARLRGLIPGLAGTGPSFQTSTVRRGDVVATVTATGPIAAVNSLPLTFKASGKLAELKVGVGDHVTKGQVLAIEDTTDLQTALEQAKAGLAQAQANLAKVQAGATSTQKAVAQTAVDNAQTAARNAQASVGITQASVSHDLTAAQNSVTTAQLSLSAAQDALKAAQDQQARGIAADQTALTNAQTNLQTVQETVAANGPILQQQLEKAKDSLWAAQISRDATCGRSKGTDCQAANASVAAAETGLSTAQAQLDQGIIQGQQQIAQAQTQRDQANAQLASDTAKLAAAVVSAQNQVKQAAQAVTTARTGLTQAQAKATATVQSAQQQADSAQGSLKAAQASYAQTAAPPQPADVATAQAQVVNAQAAVDAAQANLDAATLTAPFDGTVAAINGTVGEWITGGTGGSTTATAGSTSALFTLVNLESLQVSAQVNEADIGKIHLGDPVTYAVSAFPDKTFQGTVIAIQPQGTVTQNVVNYTVTGSIQATKDSPLYPGMTAAATIIAQHKSNVLLVPNTALSFAQSAFRDGLVQGQGNRQRAQRPGGQASGNGVGNPTQGNNGQAAGGGVGNAAQQRNGSQAAQGSGTPPSRQFGNGGFGGNGGGIANRPNAANRGIVLTMKDNQLVPVFVTIGITDGTNTEVVSGLEGGESIVVGQSGGTITAGRSGAAAGPGGPRPGGAGPFAGGFR